MPLRLGIEVYMLSHSLPRWRRLLDVDTATRTSVSGRCIEMSVVTFDYTEQVAMHLVTAQSNQHKAQHQSPAEAADMT